MPIQNPLRALVLVAACAFNISAVAAVPAGAVACKSVETPNQQKDEETIRRIERGWLAAEYQGNVDFLQCLLAPGYRVMAPNENKIRTREDLLERVAKNKGKNPVIPPLETTVVINGDSALAFSLMRTTNKAGESREIRFVDSYYFTDGVWRAYSGVDLYQP
ncbi:MAG: nuclear transport factor 2 family protein [Gammaproteobacteria bacterium]|nr:MAG: nuclear transport factor 2 family protein [Gammaproteobacteria bacterium]